MTTTRHDLSATMRVPSYYRNAAGVLPTPLRTNLVPNPSFEVGTSGWATSSSTIARTTTQAHGGTASLQVTPTVVTGGARAPIATVVGQTYTASAWVMSPTTRDVRLTHGVGGTVVTVAAGVWTRLFFTFTASSTSTNLFVSSNTTTDVYFVDEVMMEEGATLGPYFDGATPDDATYDYAWSSTANASTSHQRARHTAEQPAWFDALQDDLSGWAEIPGYDTTVVRAFSDLRQRFEMQTLANDQPGAVRRTIALTPGTYRLVAHAYVTKGAYVGVSVDTQGPRWVYLSQHLQEVEAVFTHAGGSKNIDLYIGDQFSSGPAAVWWTDVAVYAVASSTVLDLRPESATVTLDEGWSPYAQASLVCPIPAKDALGLVDPRIVNRVSLALTSSGGKSMKASDLTAMLAVTGPVRTNLLTNPRPMSSVPDGWDVVIGPEYAPLSDTWGSGVNSIGPNGLEGFLRSILDEAGLFGRDVYDAADPSYPVGTYTGSMYVRSSVRAAFRLGLQTQNVATSGYGPWVTVPAGAWIRLSHTVTTVSAGRIHVSIDSQDALAADTIVDVTQAMLEKAPAPVLDYLDGALGRPGEPAGFTAWTAVAHASTSNKTYGATYARDLTAKFGMAATSLRTNLMPNPSFETNLTGWSARQGGTGTGTPTLTRVTSVGMAGLSFARLGVTSPVSYTVNVASAARILLPVGALTVSLFVKGPAGYQAMVSARCYSAASGGSSGLSPLGGTLSLSGYWEQIHVSGQVPDGYPWVAVEVSLTRGGAGQYLSAADVLDIDAVMVEAGTSEVGPYFDGSLPDTLASDLSVDYSWTGTAHASASTALTTVSSGDIKKASYLSDLFQEQYNATLDTTLSTSRTLDLHLRSRELDWVSGTMTLTLASDEALLQDYARPGTSVDFTPPAVNDLKTLVNWGLRLAGLGALDASSTTAVIAGADVVWTPGTSLWDFLDGFVSKAGLKLWADERRRWFLLAPYLGDSGSSVTLGALTELTESLDRNASGWGDAVLVAHKWTDPGTGVTTTTYDGSWAPTFSKTVVVERDSKTPAGGALDRLTRARGRGRQGAAMTVSDYSVAPRSVVYLTTPTTALPGLILTSVRWSFPGDEMSLSTREIPT